MASTWTDQPKDTRGRYDHLTVRPKLRYLVALATGFVIGVLALNHVVPGLNAEDTYVVVTHAAGCPASVARCFPPDQPGPVGPGVSETRTDGPAPAFNPFAGCENGCTTSGHLGHAGPPVPGTEGPAGGCPTDSCSYPAVVCPAPVAACFPAEAPGPVGPGVSETRVDDQPGPVGPGVSEIRVDDAATGTDR